MSVLCNAMIVSVILYQCCNGTVIEHQEIPQHTSPRGVIHLMLIGSDAGAHYNAVINHVPESEGDNIEISDVSHQLSPASIRPFPKAPPRQKGTRKGRKKRKSAILTDTPKKNLLQEEQAKRKKPLNPRKQAKQSAGLKANKISKKCEAKRSSTGNDTQKRKAKTKLHYEDEADTSEDENSLCIICLEPFSNSRPREKWIQCSSCKRWSHEDCADVPLNGLYTCYNCTSDDSDFCYGM